MEPLLAAGLVFVISFVGLNVVEKIIHKLTKNPDRSYQLGVWLFSVLIAIYFYLDYAGR
jgi:hypothetical protein